MISLEEKRNGKHSLGDIIYVDSNFSRNYDCFGVVIDNNFWMKQAKKENVFTYTIDELKQNSVFDKQIPFRVLGTRFFRQYWKANDDAEFESDENTVMHYRCQAPIYVDSVNLKPLIEIAEIDGGRVGETLFNDSSSYVWGALNDAKVVYDYLDGKRFSPSGYIHKEDKLLRLLEQAIPIKS